MMRQRSVVVAAAIGALLTLEVMAGGQAVNGPANDIGVTQKVGVRVPLDLAFTDESGRSVSLRSYLGRKPIVLVLPFYRCRGICERIFAGLAGTLRKLKPTVGDDFQVVSVSIDPKETPEHAAMKKREVLDLYGRAASAGAWHFLVGPQPSIQSLTTTVGYKYTYDPATERIAHPAAVLVLTADGRVSRYLFGVEYPTVEFKSAVATAKASAIGPKEVSPVLLGCLTYNPVSGRYRLVVDRALKVGGATTVLVLGLSILVMSMRHRRCAIKPSGTAGHAQPPASSAG